jgi:hypothetical protein
MPPAGAHPLSIPFFSLEYRDGVFLRHIPPGAIDLGRGLFRMDGTLLQLDDDAAALAEPVIQGPHLLSLLSRKNHRLIKDGPRLAEDAERLVKLCAAGQAGVGPLSLAVRPASGVETEWLPLAGLPRYRLFQNIIYEIIDGDTMRELAVRFGAQDGRFILKGEDIPRFASLYGRLVLRFGDEACRKLLAEDAVFVPGAGLSLVSGAFREERRQAASAWAAPLLRCGERRYPAAEVSLRMDREFILLERRWARREDIEAAGIFPLGAYAGGTAIEKIRLKPGELIRRGGERFAGLFGAFEADMALWREQGGASEIFRAHLALLRFWGISGGVVLNGRREDASCLAAWLVELAASGAGNTLVLMEKRYYEGCLAQWLPRLNAANIALPGGGDSGGGDASHSPLRIGLYEDLPLTPAEQKKNFDLLALVDSGETLLQEPVFSRVRDIKAALLLGFFSGAGDRLREPAAAKIRGLFAIKDAELAPYLIRDVNRPLALPPRFAFPPPHVLRPGGAPAGGFTYTVAEKFSGLSGPSLYSELALFDSGGPAAPFVPLRLLKGSLAIERMDPDERAFFLYWRDAFRKGNILETDSGYIRVYARELCIFTGGTGGAAGNFRELLRLWESYRALFPALDTFLPRWLVDFAVVYELAESAFVPLLSHVHDMRDTLLGDQYIHRHFIVNSNPIVFDDVALLLADEVNESVFFRSAGLGQSPRPPAERSRLVTDIETAMNALDRYLREDFRLSLFEFFYPQVFDVEEREAFSGMERAGRSSYCVTGIRFSKHPPLLAFLSGIFRYVEHCFKIKNELDLKNKTPPLDEKWKRIVDNALGLAALVPVQTPSAIPVQPLVPHITLVESRISALRSDSDTVRDLLAIENENGDGAASDPPAPVLRAAAPPRKKITVKAFIETRDETARAMLALISRGADQAALADFARLNHTMPEIIIDAINAAFLEQAGDLLIDTVDEQPALQSEYTEEVKKLLWAT